MQLTNNIKRIFLSFAQQYYRDVHPTLTWNVDPRLTKIFIGDKFIAAPAVYEKMPSILLSRGSAAYANTSIDLMQSMGSPVYTETKKRTDLIRGSVTFNCLSQNGVEAEDMANTIFQQIVGFKDQFRARGIHQILGVSISEEQPVRGDVVPRLALVAVTVMYTAQVGIMTIEDLYSIQVFTDSQYLGQLSSQRPGARDWYMYGYTIDGNKLLFNYAPAVGTNVLTNFTGAITLTPYTNYTPSGLIDGTNTEFTLPEAPYTAYTTLSGILIYVSGLENFTS